MANQLTGAHRRWVSEECHALPHTLHSENLWMPYLHYAASNLWHSMSKPEAAAQRHTHEPDHEDNDMWCWGLIGAFALGALALVWVPLLLFR